ncbi:MAG: sensor histidine kinase [Acidimicrobiia bacterium]
MTTLSRRARIALVTAVIVYLAAAVTLVLVGTPLAVGQAVANGAFMAIGAIIFVRKPGNVVGALLVTLGVLWNAIHAADVAAAWYAEAGAVEVASWIGFVFSPIVPFATWLQVPMILLFPHGRVSSVWDRRFIRWTGIYASMVALLALVGRPLLMAGPTHSGYPHPFVDAELAGQLGEVGDLSFFLILVAFLVATVRLIMRARRSDPVERRQIGWVGFACALYFVLGVSNGIFDPLGAYENGFAFFDAVVYLAIPIAIAIAIFRYRLYEIDRILSRSVTFGGLALFIAGVYVAIVVGVGRLLGGEAGFGLSVAASVLVALAFQPARRRVERWANRLVYGERATPHEVLVRFSHRSSELSDEELLDRIPQLMVDGTGARSAALWTRKGDGFATAAVWPAGAGVRTLGGGDGFEDPEADFSLPVFHDGELLGGLSLGKEPGEAVTPAEEGLLSDLASGLGLALRNARLTGELRRQVTELEASRERVLVAADAARRQLEHTLDSGPQQQLVALKVKLGPTRMLAERSGAEKTASLLGQLEQQAGDAIKAVRDFAGGIYPPTLEAEGLVMAIRQQVRSAALPVSISGEGCGRFPREVEAAVYFSVLESVQNSTKYADATSVVITLSERGGALTFEVTDDGNGFDPETVTLGAGLNGIADRLDTVGGTIHIDSTPGVGTTITGIVPISAAVDD